MNHKWMHACRVSAKMFCSVSGGPLCVILWGGVTDWGSHKWTDGRVWETDARPGRSELRGSGLLAADGIESGCNSLAEILWGLGVCIWASLPFPPTLICGSLKGQLDLVQVSQEPILCSPFFPLWQLADCSELKGFIVTLLTDAQNNPSKGKLIALLQGSRKL